MFILITIIGLSLLIIVHELGHFLTAKLFGLKVDEFGFGLPPRAIGKRIGETIYSLNWLPFGGYVKIYGEDTAGEQLLMSKDTTNGYEQKDTEATNGYEHNTTDTTDTTNGYENKESGGKIIEKELSYKINGVLFQVHKELGRFAKEKKYADLFEEILRNNNLNYKREQRIALGNKIFHILDFIVEDKILIEFKSKSSLTRLDYDQIKSYLNATNITLGLLVNFRDRRLDVKRVINLSEIRSHSQPFVDSQPDVRSHSQPDVRSHSQPFVDFNRSFVAQKAWKKSIIILAGVFMNFVFGWFLISAVFMMGTPQGVYISEVKVGSPADIAGIMRGDKIIGYNAADPFIAFVNGNRGKEVLLKFERGNEEKIINIIPRSDPPEGEGALGIALVEGGTKLGFFESIINGFNTTIQLIGLIVIAISKLIAGLFVGGADYSSIAGPVGIFVIAKESGALGIVGLLNFLAILSINLGVINAVPFPALDGGRFLFILIEKITRTSIPVKFERAVNGIGLSLLILLLIIISIRDIQRIIM